MIKKTFMFSLSLVSVIWLGFVLSLLWKWFVSDVFGVFLLTTPQALGLCLMIRIATLDYRIKTECNQNDVLTMKFLAPALALFFGYIYTLFM